MGGGRRRSARSHHRERQRPWPGKLADQIDRPVIGQLASQLTGRLREARTPRRQPLGRKLARGGFTYGNEGCITGILDTGG